MNAKRTTPVIHIRLAAKDDAAGISAVLHASFAEYESSYTPEAFAATAPASDQIARRLEECPVWVVFLDGQIVGTGSAVEKGVALYIRGMAVLPEARGLRIGELLLERIEDFASEHGYSRLVLSTTGFLSRAIRLYEKAGFRRSSEGPEDLLGTPLFTVVKDVAD